MARASAGGMYRQMDEEQRTKLEAKLREMERDLEIAKWLRHPEAKLAADDWNDFKSDAAPEFSGLIDFSQAELSVTSNDVLRLALMMRQEEHRSRGWLAFVVRDSAAYGVVRMLGYWSRSADRVKIFQNREEAEYWLEQRAERPPIRFDEARVVSREPSLLKVS